MGKKKESDGAQPPSMFDNLDLFGIVGADEAAAPQEEAPKKLSPSVAALTGSGRCAIFTILISASIRHTLSARARFLRSKTGLSPFSGA